MMWHDIIICVSSGVEVGKAQEAVDMLLTWDIKKIISCCTENLLQWIISSTKPFLEFNQPIGICPFAAACLLETGSGKYGTFATMARDSLSSSQACVNMGTHSNNAAPSDEKKFQCDKHCKLHQVRCTVNNFTMYILCLTWYVETLNKQSNLSILDRIGVVKSIVGTDKPINPFYQVDPKHCQEKMI
jgi:hypothetical protein